MDLYMYGAKYIFIEYLYVVTNCTNVYHFMGAVSDGYLVTFVKLVKRRFRSKLTNMANGKHFRNHYCPLQN